MDSSRETHLLTISFLFTFILTFLTANTGADYLIYQDYTGKSILFCCLNNNSCDSLTQNTSLQYVPDSNYTTCYEISYADNLNFFDLVYDNILILTILLTGLVILAILFIKRK